VNCRRLGVAEHGSKVSFGQAALVGDQGVALAGPLRWPAGMEPPAAVPPKIHPKPDKFSRNAWTLAIAAAVALALVAAVLRRKSNS
jgi:hypothetical protein